MMNIKHQGKLYSMADQQLEVFKLLRDSNKPLTNKQIQRNSSLIWPTNRISELIAMGVNVTKGRIKVKSRGRLVSVNTYYISC